MRLVAILMFLLLSWTARAQVSVDLRALDQAGPATVPTRPAQPRQPAPPIAATPAITAVPPPAARSSTAATPPTADAARPGIGKPAPAATAIAPLAPPAPTVPLPVLPTVSPAMPPPSTTQPPPPRATAPKPSPVHLQFATGQAALSPDDEAAIRALAHAIPTPASSSVNVVAYAAGKPDDPSMARRISLSRGMAVRAVLLDSGIPSAQIYVRALGSNVKNNPTGESADRVELTVAGIGEVTQ